MRKRKIKMRVMAVCVAIFALIPLALLVVSAYPAEEFIPASGDFHIGGSTVPLDGANQGTYNIIDHYNYTHPPMQITYAFDIGDMLLSASVDWSYISFQANPYNEIQGYTGHYTIGFMRQNRGNIQVRIGSYLNGVGDWWYTEDVDMINTAQILCGYIVTSQPGTGVPALIVQYYAIDREGRVIQSYYDTHSMELLDKQLIFDTKTEYAMIKAKYIDPYNTDPHSPYDLISLKPFADDYYKQYEDGYNKASSDSANTFDNLGKLLWTIVDMPFVLISQVLNFDLFGINVGALAMSLLTVGLVVFALKKVGVI